MEYFFELCQNLKTVIDIICLFVTLYTVYKSMNRKYKYRLSNRTNIDLLQGMNIPDTDEKHCTYHSVYSDISKLATVVEESDQMILENDMKERALQIDNLNIQETHFKQVSSSNPEPHSNGNSNSIALADEGTTLEYVVTQYENILMEKDLQIDITNVPETLHEQVFSSKPEHNSNDSFNPMALVDLLNITGTPVIEANKEMQFDNTHKERDDQIYTLNSLETNSKIVSPSHHPDSDFNSNFNPIAPPGLVNAIDSPVIEAYKMSQLENDFNERADHLDISDVSETINNQISYNRLESESNDNFNSIAHADSLLNKCTLLVNEEYEITSFDHILKVGNFQIDDSKFLENQHKHISSSTPEPDSNYIDAVAPPVLVDDKSTMLSNEEYEITPFKNFLKQDALHIDTTNFPEPHFKQFLSSKPKRDPNDIFNLIAFAESVNAIDTPVIEVYEEIQFDNSVKVRDNQIYTSNSLETNYKQISSSKLKPDSDGSCNSIALTDSLKAISTPAIEAHKVFWQENCINEEAHQLDISDVPEANYNQVSCNKPETDSNDIYNSIISDSLYANETLLFNEEKEEAIFENYFTGEAFQIKTSDVSGSQLKQISFSKLDPDSVKAAGAPFIEAHKVIQQENCINEKAHQLDISDVPEANYNQVSCSKPETDSNDIYNSIISVSVDAKETLLLNEEKEETTFENIFTGEAFQIKASEVSGTQHKQISFSKLDPDSVKAVGAPVIEAHKVIQQENCINEEAHQLDISDAPEASYNQVSCSKPETDSNEIYNSIISVSVDAKETLLNEEKEETTFENIFTGEAFQIKASEVSGTQHKQILFSKLDPDSVKAVGAPVIEAHKVIQQENCINEEAHQLDISDAPEASYNQVSCSKPETDSNEIYNSIISVSVDAKETLLNEEKEETTFENIFTGEAFQIKASEVSGTQHKQISFSKLDPDSVKAVGAPVIEAHKVIQQENCINEEAHQLDISDAPEASYNQVSCSKPETDSNEIYNSIISVSVDAKETLLNEEKEETTFENIFTGEAFQIKASEISGTQHKQISFSKLDPDSVKAVGAPVIEAHKVIQQENCINEEAHQLDISDAPEASYNQVSCSKPESDSNDIYNSIISDSVDAKETLLLNEEKEETTFENIFKKEAFHIKTSDVSGSQHKQISFSKLDPVSVKAIGAPVIEAHKVIQQENCINEEAYQLDISDVPEANYNEISCSKPETDSNDIYNSIISDSVDAKETLLLNEEKEETTFENIFTGEDFQIKTSEVSGSQHKQISFSKLDPDSVKAAGASVIEAHKMIQQENCINEEAHQLDISDVPEANYNQVSFSKLETDSNDIYNFIISDDSVDAKERLLNEEKEETALESIFTGETFQIKTSEVSENQHKQILSSKLDPDSNFSIKSVALPELGDTKGTTLVDELTSFKNILKKDLQIDITNIPQTHLRQFLSSKTEHDSYDSLNSIAFTDLTNDASKTQVNEEYEVTSFGNTHKKKVLQTDTSNISETHYKHDFSNKLEFDSNYLLNSASTDSVNSKSSLIIEADELIQPIKIDNSNNRETHYEQVFSSKSETDSNNHFYPRSLADDPYAVAIQSSDLVNATSDLDLNYFKMMLSVFNNSSSLDKVLRKEEESHVLEDFRANFETRSKTFSKVAANKCANEGRPADSSGLDQLSNTDLEFPKLNSAKKVNLKKENIDKHKKSKRKKKKKSIAQEHVTITDTESELKMNPTLTQWPIAENNLPVTTCSISFNDSTLSGLSNAHSPCRSVSLNTTFVHSVPDNLLKISAKSYSQIVKDVPSIDANADCQSKSCIVSSPRKSKSTKAPSASKSKPCNVPSSKGKTCKVPSPSKSKTCKVSSPSSPMKNVNKKKYRIKIPKKSSCKSKITSVKETSLTFEGKSEVGRATCFLYGVSLSDLFLTNIFKTGQVVEYDIRRTVWRTETKVVEKYYIGKEIQCQKQMYEKLKEYCWINKIESSTKCYLLHLTGFVPEDCAPMPKMLESIAVVEI